MLQAKHVLCVAVDASLQLMCPRIPARLKDHHGAYLVHQ